MIIKNLEKYKVSTTKQAVTSFAGLPLLLGMAKRLGLQEAFNALRVKERDRGYRPAEVAFTLMGMIQSGGVALDDVRVLQGDEGLRDLLGDLPASNTLGEWLRRFSRSMVARLGKIQLATAKKVIAACGLRSIIVDVDAFFLDVANPYDYIPQVRAALKPGGFFCSLIPTYNQVEKLLYSLRRNNFAFIEMCEILLRFYKAEPARLRPTDRMVAHTGFLVFARRIEPSTDPRAVELLREQTNDKEKGERDAAHVAAAETVENDPISDEQG